jgi:SAM-dependent methyltransferase
MTAQPAAAPVPPADPGSIKCQCADLWSHPAAQLLLGPALRPGGADLTARLIDGARLPPGSTVLDVGCGPGATLELLAAAGHRSLGIDFSPVLAADAIARDMAALAGDAEHLPLRGASADAALMECVLSALPDKDRAIGEVARVVRPGGLLLLSDMTLAADFPEPLNSALAWVACAAGALSAPRYSELLSAHGFAVESIEDRSADLLAMVAKARRRFALFRGAAGLGLLPPLEEFVGSDLTALGRAMLGHDDLHAGGRHVLGQVSQAVTEGAMGYVAISARRRRSPA